MKTEDDWIMATTDLLDFCHECRERIDRCQCLVCSWCGQQIIRYAAEDHFPYCSVVCSVSAEGEGA